jgi:hypothetical protein
MIYPICGRYRGAILNLCLAYVLARMKIDDLGSYLPYEKENAGLSYCQKENKRFRPDGDVDITQTARSTR